MYTAHHSSKSALATKANHFAKVGGMTYAFTDEDECWRFVHMQRSCFQTDPKTFLDASYISRRHLAA